MKTIYIILNLSHDCDDYCYDEIIEYIFDSYNDAILKMDKLKVFCESQLNNNNYTYHYVLREFEIPYDRVMSGEGKFLAECKNYIDE